MKKDVELIAFRCPDDLMERMHAIALCLHTSRSALMVKAVRILMEQLYKRDGFIVPPYSSKKPL